jgi:hypothetical protein
LQLSAGLPARAAFVAAPYQLSVAGNLVDEIWRGQLFSYGKSLGCHGEAAWLTIATKLASFQVTSLVSGLNGFTGVEVYKLNIIIILRVTFDCIKGLN